MTDNVRASSVTNSIIPDIIGNNDNSNNNSSTVNNSNNINPNTEIANNINTNSNSNNSQNLSNSQINAINSINLSPITNNLNSNDISNTPFEKLFNSYFNLSQEYNEAKASDSKSTRDGRTLDQILDSMDSIKNLINQEKEKGIYDNRVLDSVSNLFNNINQNIEEFKDVSFNNLSILNKNIEAIMKDVNVSQQNKVELLQDVFSNIKNENLNSKKMFLSAVKELVASSVKNENFLQGIDLNGQQDEVEKKAINILTSRIMENDNFDPKTVKLSIDSLFNEYKAKKNSANPNHSVDINSLKLDFANRIEEFAQKPIIKIEKGRHFEQSKNSNTCFILSVVNALTHSDKGLAVLKNVVKEDGIVFNHNNQQIKIPFKAQTSESFSPLEEAFIEAYKYYDPTYDKKEGGDMYNIATKILGLNDNFGIIGNSNGIDDAWNSIKEKVKNGSFGVVHTGGHYLSIVDFSEDPDGKKWIDVKNSSSNKLEKIEFNDNFYYANYTMQFFNLPEIQQTQQVNNAN